MESMSQSVFIICFISVLLENIFLVMVIIIIIIGVFIILLLEWSTPNLLQIVILVLFWIYLPSP